MLEWPILHPDLQLYEMTWYKNKQKHILVKYSAFTNLKNYKQIKIFLIDNSLILIFVFTAQLITYDSFIQLKIKDE